MDSFLTVEQVSKVLQLGKTNTYKLFRKKDFPKITIGKKLLVRESKLDEYLQKYSKSIIDL